MRNVCYETGNCAQKSLISPLLFVLPQCACDFKNTCLPLPHPPHAQEGVVLICGLLILSMAREQLDNRAFFFGQVYEQTIIQNNIFFRKKKVILGRLSLHFSLGFNLRLKFDKINRQGKLQRDDTTLFEKKLFSLNNQVVIQYNCYKLLLLTKKCAG